MTRDDVLAALPLLKQPDLLAIQGVISRLLGASNVGGLGPPSANLYNVLAALLGASVPYDAFMKGSQGKLWGKHAPRVLEFIAATFPNIKTRVEEQAMMRLVLGLVVDDLKGRLRATPSLGMVASNLGRVPELFDSAFPSYRESGLAHLIPQVMGVE